jgi:ribonuclease P protein component
MRYVGVVRKKIYKQAVARNRVKRVLRESFFSYLPQLDQKYWILIDLKKKTELKRSVLSQKTYQLISESGLK